MALAGISLEEGIDAATKIMACKNPKEALVLQSGLAKSSYNKTVTETKRISDMSVTLVESVVAPLNGRVAVAVEKFSKPLAA